MTQLERVVKSMKGKGWLTLRDIERLCRNFTGVYDSQAAISARLREYGKLAALGFVRERKTRNINGKTVYFYRLTRIKK